MEVREGEDVSYLIIDEMSMVGRRSLGQIDHLLSKKGPIEVRCCDRREGEGCMYLAKYLTKNDALALTEEDGDDGLPPLLVDLYVWTRHCLDQALTEHLPFVDLHVLTIHCLDQALTKHSPFVDLHVLTRHCLDQALTKYLPFVDLHVLKRHCLDQALTKHSLVVWIPMF